MTISWKAADRESEWEINIIIMIKIKMFRVIIRFKSFRIWLRKNDLFFDFREVQRSLCLMKLSVKKCFKIRYTTMHEHKFYSFAENHLTYLLFFSVMDIKKNPVVSIFQMITVIHISSNNDFLVTCYINQWSIHINILILKNVKRLYSKWF